MCPVCQSWLCKEHLAREKHDCSQMDEDREIAPALNDLPRRRAEEIQAILSKPDDWRDMWK